MLERNRAQVGEQPSSPERKRKIKKKIKKSKKKIKIKKWKKRRKACLTLAVTSQCRIAFPKTLPKKIRGGSQNEKRAGRWQRDPTTFT